MTIQKHNDEFGWKRGLGAYSKDDNEFGAPRHKYDKLNVEKDKEYSLIDNEVDQPAGKYFGGGGPVSHNKRTLGPPRYAPKTGPLGIAKRPR